MNKFQKTMEEVRRLAADLGVSENSRVFREPIADDKEAPKDADMRLPYSSEPEPIARPWK